jgi:hypothetical protein
LLSTIERLKSEEDAKLNSQNRVNVDRNFKEKIIDKTIQTESGFLLTLAVAVSLIALMMVIIVVIHKLSVKRSGLKNLI